MCTMKHICRYRNNKLSTRLYKPSGQNDVVTTSFLRRMDMAERRCFNVVFESRGDVKSQRRNNVVTTSGINSVTQKQRRCNVVN